MPSADFPVRSDVSVLAPISVRATSRPVGVRARTRRMWSLTPVHGRAHGMRDWRHFRRTTGPASSKFMITR